MDVQLATVEALALAIEAKAGLHPGAHPIDSAVRRRARRSVRPVRRRRPGGSNGGPAARRRQHGGAGAHPGEARASSTPEEFERIKIHPRVGAEILRNVPFGAPVGEHGSLRITSDGTAWGIRRGCSGERDPDRRPHPGHRRLLQHAADRASVPARPQRGSRPGDPPGACRHGVRSRIGRRRSSGSGLRPCPSRTSLDAAAWMDAVAGAATARSRTSPARTARSRRSTRSRRRSARACPFATRWR